MGHPIVPSLGLLHIMEDMFKVIQGKTIAPDRREYVFQHACQFFADVETAEKALKGENVTINIAHRGEVDSLRLYERFLEWVVVCPSVRAMSASEVKEALALLKASGVLEKRRSFIEFFDTFCEWLAVVFDQQRLEPTETVTV